MPRALQIAVFATAKDAKFAGFYGAWQVHPGALCAVHAQARSLLC